MPRPVPHKKYTDLPNQITGSYHNDQQLCIGCLIVAVAVTVLAAILIVGEFTGLTSKLFGTV